MTLPPFPEVWDSSIRSTWTQCPRNFYYAHILNLRKSSTSIHLHFGRCVAKAMEVARKAYFGPSQHDELTSVSLALTSFIKEWGDYELPLDIEHTRAGVKTLDAGLDAILSYFEQFPLGSDSVRPLMINNEPMVEKSFALPVPGTRHPVTGEPIIYAGRFDMIGEFGDANFIVDEKTSTALGASWRSNWQLRGQFSGYIWGARSFGVDASGCIVRGIGILKSNIMFEQCIVTRPQWQVEQWLEQLRRDINRAADTWLVAKSAEELVSTHTSFDQALDSACSSYGGCSYQMLCDSEHPDRWYDNYLVIPWNPLHRVGEE